MNTLRDTPTAAPEAESAPCPQGSTAVPEGDTRPRNGADGAPTARRSDITRARIAELWIAGWKREAIAAEVGLTPNTVSAHRRQLGIAPRRNDKLAGMTREVWEAMRNAGMSYRAIAGTVSASAAAVHHKARREGWR